MEMTVHIGWTSTRPVQPDQFWSSVTVVAESPMACEILAHDMVRGRPECVMVTSIIPVL